ncbi:hypothetical protein DQ04_00981060 [Trypanosoma grayi]|uniref:hypothetical protein n=1 Tax=Trypanosoma grayi TaxID=71804 RepID=UPI0004F420E9|nr:hypothetical protein DQ04_00981060 [Trypanosoma grayi]KEG13476.1 hypothetical protein DQ04_00981060 [Trypanosoma grayi]
MLTHKAISQSAPVLSLLVREAYRSLHFSNAATASTVIAALGDLREPPLSTHALVLSVLTVLPDFRCCVHVARLMRGLSLLQVRHPMLTAHLLKCYLRCCFVKESTTVVAQGVLPTVGCGVVHPLVFLSSFATVLRVLEYQHCPLRFVDALLDSVEEMLGSGHVLASLCQSHHKYHHSEDGDDIDGFQSEVNSEGTSADIFLVMHCHVLRCRRRRHRCCGLQLNRLDALLASFAGHLHCRHILSLLLALEGAGEHRQEWRTPFCQVGEMGECQKVLLHNLALRLQPTVLAPGLLTKAEIVAVLRHVNHFSLSGVPQDAQRRLCRLVDALCTLLETAPLSLDTVRQLAVDDLLACDEGNKVSRQLNAVWVSEFPRKPRLGFFLDALQQAIEPSESCRSGGGYDCRLAETVLDVCHRLLLLRSVAGAGAVSLASIRRACNLACTMLDKLRRRVVRVDPTVHLRLFATCEPLKVLLRQRAASSGEAYALLLTEEIARYETGVIHCLASTSIAHDVYLRPLCSIMCGRQPTDELLAIVDGVLPAICGGRTATRDTAELLVKLASVLRSEEWVRFCGDDARWVMVAASARLREAVKVLHVTVASSEEDMPAHHALGVLLGLLAVICPIERRRDMGQQRASVAACLPASVKALSVACGLLRSCAAWIPEPQLCSSSQDTFALPVVHALSVAEYYALQSRSSKQWRHLCCGAENSCCVLDDSNDNPDAFHQLSARWHGRGIVMGFTLWLGAFRCGIELAEDDTRRVARTMLDMCELRQLHLTTLRSVTQLVLSDGDWTCPSLRQQLLRAVHLMFVCETPYGEDVVVPNLAERVEFARIAPLLIMELFRVVHVCAVGETPALKVEHGAAPSSVSLPSCLTGSDFEMDGVELAELLLRLLDEFQRSEESRRPLRALHCVVWDSLTCIASLSSVLNDWVERFRQSRSFHAEDVLDGNGGSGILHQQHGDRAAVIVANTRNTLLWSLLILACFMRHPKSALDANTAAQLAAARHAVARLVQLVSHHMPILRRCRPAPESLLALRLCEAVEGTSGAPAGSEFVSVVLSEVLRREKDHLCFWEGAFSDVAEALRRYL